MNCRRGPQGVYDVFTFARVALALLQAVYDQPHPRKVESATNLPADVLKNLKFGLCGRQQLPQIGSAPSHDSESPMTLNELASSLYHFTFDDTAVIDRLYSLSEKVGVDAQSLRNEIAVFKIFVIDWFVNGSSLIRGRYGSQVAEELLLAYLTCLKRRLDPENEEEFLSSMERRLKAYNLAHDRWYAACETKSPGVNIDVEETFSRFAGIDPSHAPLLVLVMYPYLKSLWSTVGEMLERSELA
jgi:hypothetical protein